MTISDIIDGLEEVQYGEALDEVDMRRLCDLTKQLATHVQKLEIDRGIHNGVEIAHTCADNPNLSCPACTKAELTSTAQLDIEDKFRK